LALRIAIIGSRGYPYIYSGYETFVKELSERLIKNDFNVTVYCHKNLFNSFPKSVNGINLVYIRTIEKKSLSQFIHSFRSVLHASLRNFDLIFVVNSANGPFGLITKLLGKKTVINVDGLEWMRPKWKGIGNKYFYYASKIATKLYDEIVTDSYEMQKIYKKEFNASTTVISYGANEAKNGSSGLIKKWNLDSRQYYLVVGRLIPDNNSDFIIKEFLKSNSTKKLVIVGDVPYKDPYAVSVKAAKDERIIFTGYIYNQDELAELYLNCFVYIHGHQFGGTNPTMLQALADNCAIIALDTVFNREMLDNGKYGLFFNKNNGDLTTLISFIEDDPDILERLRQISRNRIEENYTWEKVTNQYISLFQKLILDDAQ
jgi:glycosyltransferase involved in cell wall biosynthesis